MALYRNSMYAIFIVLMSEIFEEYIESIIALGMASLITTLVTKVISTLCVITLTQATKIALKTILVKVFKLLLKGERTREMTKKILEFIKCNKWSLIIGVFVAFISGYCGFLLCDIYTNIALWLKAIICIAVGVVFFGLVLFVGKDTTWALTLRMANKVLTKDKYDQICKLYTELESLQISENIENAKKAEDARAEDKEVSKIAKTLKKGETKESAKERKAKEDAEILELAKKIKAEMDANKPIVDGENCIDNNNTNM